MRACLSRAVSARRDGRAGPGFWRRAAFKGFDQDHASAAAGAWCWLRWFFGGLLGRYFAWRSRRRRDAKQCAGFGDVFDAASISEQTVVPDAMKAVGQNMQQKAADEFG